MKLSATSNQYAFRSRTVSRMETDILPSNAAKQKWLKIHSTVDTLYSESGTKVHYQEFLHYMVKFHYIVKIFDHFSSGFTICNEDLKLHYMEYSL